MLIAVGNEHLKNRLSELIFFVKFSFLAFPPNTQKMRFLSEKYKNFKYFHWYSQSSLPFSKGNWAKSIVLESESGIFLFKMPNSYVHFPIATFT